MAVYDHEILTPWSRVILQKVIVAQLVKKFPAFDGIRNSITAFIWTLF
jgi:hypothetical protein